MTSADHAFARRVVAQHATTARLLGADCVPSFSPRGPVTAAEPATGPTPSGRDRGAAQAKLDEIRARYERDAPHKHFVSEFQNIVFGEGDPCARLMFIGEAPGAEEDRTGRPFVGRAGELLERMLTAMGIARQEVYIANVLKTRPPDNATPTSDEAELCAPYLFHQIEAVAPELIVTLGLPATRLILRSTDNLSDMRAHWSQFVHPQTGFTVPVMPTFHPAFLLRQYTPENRSKVWSDLQQVMVRLGFPTRPGV